MSPKSVPKGAEALRARDVKPAEQPQGAKRVAGGLAGWVDDRTSTAKPMSYVLRLIIQHLTPM